MHDFFFPYFSRWTNRWTLQLHGMSKVGSDSVRLIGLAIPDSLRGSVQAMSLHYRSYWNTSDWAGWVHLRDLETGTHERYQGWLQYREKSGMLKILFWFRSWCEWRVTTILRTGGRHSSGGAGSSSQLSEARLTQHHLSPLYIGYEKVTRQIKIEFWKKQM